VHSSASNYLQSRGDQLYGETGQDIFNQTVIIRTHRIITVEYGFDTDTLILTRRTRRL
jgi:hypothetical protein